MRELILLLIALLNGGWMVFDGVHVLRTGKYFGPDVPGPWQKLVRWSGLDPFKLGVPFVLLGIAWILIGLAVSLDYEYARTLYFIAAIASLWYLPVGTILAAISLLILVIP